MPKTIRFGSEANAVSGIRSETILPGYSADLSSNKHTGFGAGLFQIPKALFLLESWAGLCVQSAPMTETGLKLRPPHTKLADVYRQRPTGLLPHRKGQSWAGQETVSRSNLDDPPVSATAGGGQRLKRAERGIDVQQPNVVRQNFTSLASK